MQHNSVDQRGTNQQDAAENYTVRSSIICAPCHVLFECLNHGGWDGQACVAHIGEETTAYKVFVQDLDMDGKINIQMDNVS
jgi:hypothetical protein